MIKRVLLGLLLLPCIVHAMEERVHRCVSEDEKVTTYSKGKWGSWQFEQVSYDKNTETYTTHASPYGEGSVGRLAPGLYEILSKAYEKQQKRDAAREKEDSYD